MNSGSTTSTLDKPSNLHECPVILHKTDNGTTEKLTDSIEKTKIPKRKNISKKEDNGADRRSSATLSTVLKIGQSINTQAETRGEVQRNILGGEWDREKWFDSNGGTLRKEGSGVQLNVPQNAVKRGSTAHISGKVFTNVKIFYATFKLRETERPVSPIVEFKDHNQVQFDQHLMVKIPIVFKSQSDPSFRVLSISGGDQVESIPLADTTDKAKPDVYYEMQHGAVCVFTKHFSLFICASCNSKSGPHECLLFGSRIPYPIAEKSEVKLRLYMCDCLLSIEDFRTNLCYKEKQWNRDCWDGKQIKTRNWDFDDTVCSSIVLSKEATRDWEIKTRPDGSPLFEFEPQLFRDIQEELTTLVGEWTYTTRAMGALFQCFIDIVRKHGDDCKRCITFDVTKDGTVNVQDLTDKCANGLIGVRDILMKSLNNDQARDLARKMNMNETDLIHILTNNATNARECVSQIVIGLQGQHGTEFDEKLLPSLDYIGRRDVMEQLPVFAGAPFQGTRKRAEERTEEPFSRHSPPNKKIK